MNKAPHAGAVPPPPELPAQAFPVGQLMARRRTGLRFAPDAGQRMAIATALGLIDLPDLRFDGEAAPQGRDLVLTGRLTARAVQACVVTLAPVPARIDEPLRRRFLADWQEPQGDEAEIPADDTIEPMPAVIDLAAIVIEALALALPEYPRAPDAELGGAEFPPQGSSPDGAEPTRPLAGLAELLSRKGGQG